MRAPFRIGLLGLGNVGGALATRLTRDADRITEAAGRPISLEFVAVARSDGRPLPAPQASSEAIVGRRDLDAVVELIGGLEPAHTYINAALTGGRQVVTANKQVIAAFGPELARLGPLRFEASVASAIPIVETLAEALAADRIHSIVGILNGTTNAMLEAMTAGASYDAALAEAQRRGLAEADPSADVDAHDPAAKLAILAMLAFHRRIDPSTIERVGIRNISRKELLEAAEHDSVIKLLASATFAEGVVEADVRPRLLSIESPMARVSGPMNAIALEAEYAGSLLLTGPGAGPDAAASAVLADLVRAARGIPPAAGDLLASLADSPPAPLRPPKSHVRHATASAR